MLLDKKKCKHIINHFSCYYFFIEKSKFLDGNKRSDNSITVPGTVGQPLTINCPEHTDGVGTSIVWGNLPEGEGIPTIYKMGVPPFGDIFFGDQGQLIFQSLTPEEVKMINDAGGVSCILYLGSPEVSKQILINTGIYIIVKYIFLCLCILKDARSYSN